MMESSPVLSLSQSFTTYSSSRLTEIAARVVEEFRDEEVDEGFNYFSTNVEGDIGGKGFYEELNNEKEDKIEKAEDGGENGEEEEGDEEFEFAFAAKDFISSPTPADEIFYNGQIRPIYPIFDTSLLFDGVKKGKENENLCYDKSIQKPLPVPETIRLPLRKLFIEERESLSSCSSSEADELDGVAPGTYCVWNPKAAGVEASAAARGHCKKSNSTGSSKRWKFRDLLHRSSSDGKDRFVFFTHSNSHNGVKDKRREEKAEKSEKTAVASAKVADRTTEPHCGKNGGQRRRVSYLPYRQDLMGLFSNVNGLSRDLHPF